MQKIPTLFLRDPEDPRRVLDVVTPGCEWVLAGEGVATRKWNGTCVLLDATGTWWARRTVESRKPTPRGFWEIEADPRTGKLVGWEPMGFSGFARWHAQALTLDPSPRPAGTYELVGPKINGNPERLAGHELVRHGAHPFPNPYSPERLIEACRRARWEGVVWHHPDGRMAKLKVRDYPQESKQDG